MPLAVGVRNKTQRRRVPFKGDKGRSFLERSKKRPNVLLVGASLVGARGYACITFPEGVS